MRALWGGFGLAIATTLVVLACSSARLASDPEHPALVFPARLPEADGGSGSIPSETRDRARRAREPADPVPAPHRTEWRITLRYHHGTIALVKAEPIELGAPAVLPKSRGRYALELWSESELLARTRFDFPLLAAEPPANEARRPLRPLPEFGPGADVMRTIRVPDREAATRAVVVDRESGARTELAWPPEADPRAKDAGPG